jgi:hypothetical protein
MRFKRFRAGIRMITADLLQTTAIPVRNEKAFFTACRIRATIFIIGIFMPVRRVPYSFPF